jgi:hypothetical protein
LEQREEDRSDLRKWDQLLGCNKLKDPGNAIKATIRNLAPYYQVYKSLILQRTNLPDIRLKNHFTREQFKAATTRIEKFNLATEARKKATQEKWRSQNKMIIAAQQKLTNLRTTVNCIRKYADNFVQGNLMEIESYKVEFQRVKVPTQSL